MAELNEQPHRRWDPLNGEWVLVSPHRAKRPWLGKTENAARAIKINYDADCYLCPGNKRISGHENPKYNGPFVFKNDFQALSDLSAELPSKNDPLFLTQSALGESHVVCFSHDHSKTLANMGENEIQEVINCFISKEIELSARFQWVQIFENRGEIMGCSNPHPHAQIWACDFVPSIVQKEIENQNKWHEENQSCLLSCVLKSELATKERVVAQNSSWAVLVPFWAKWPFETILLPKFDVKNLYELNAAQIKDLSNIISILTKKYDAVFDCEFPYSMGWHGAPNGNQKNDGLLLHAHFYPPLLRSSSVKKFMVGFEMLCEAQRDMTPESAAQILRNV